MDNEYEMRTEQMNKDYEMLQKLETQCYGEGSVYAMQRKGGDEIYACKVVSDISNGHKEGHIMQHLMKHLKSKDKERVVCLKDYHRDGVATYLVLEHCKGSLVEADHDDFTEEDAAIIIESLTKGIKAIHSAGVVHRNLKLDNVVVTHDDKVKIGDFSSSAYFDRKSPSSSSGEVKHCVVGAPKMITPEALHGSSYGKEVDIYNLGVILYQLLEQRPVFQGVSDEELSAAMLSKEDYPKRLLKFERATSGARELILRMMDVDPKKRIVPKDILEHKWVKMMLRGSKLYHQTVMHKEPLFSAGLQTALNKMSDKHSVSRARKPTAVSKVFRCTGCLV